MHSSRMRTARSSSHHGGGRGGLHPPEQKTPWEQTSPTLEQAPPLNFPLGGGPGDPLARSPSTSSLVVGLEMPPDQIPLNFPLGCGPGDPPNQIPSTSPPGCGSGNLQGMLGCHPPIPPPPPQRPAARHAGIQTNPPNPPPPPSPMNRIKDSCKNITFPQLRLRAVNIGLNFVMCERSFSK